MLILGKVNNIIREEVNYQRQFMHSIKPAADSAEKRYWKLED